MEKLAQGAESSIFVINSNILQKIRNPKEYRNSELDLKLRRSRCKKEFKILKKLFESEVNVPEPFEIDLKETKFTFEYLHGNELKAVLNKEILLLAFKEICKLHQFGVVHGDLTTLNMLFVEKQVYIIDFGLSSITENIEERGVDLNLFFRCIENEHREFYGMREKLLRIYSEEVKDGDKVIKRLNEIELRGRNKTKS
jgi:Kae1-associated kinase Bud32